ncbi:MAG: SAM-dependent methyltransferase [Bdellovibrionales bacterium]
MANDFNISDVLPWGRSAEEYRVMFMLGDLSPSTRVLDVAGGPASFNAEMTQAGFRVVSVDPLYQFTEAEIRQRMEETRGIMMEGVRKARDRFVWDFFSSPEALESARMAAMERFLSDYAAGLSAKRYAQGALPQLPFADLSFDLAVCSHMMFLYADVLDEAWHIAALGELLRVAPEARFYPLLDLNGQPSPHVTAARRWAQSQGYSAETRCVAYAFQRGANDMLVIKR